MSALIASMLFFSLTAFHQPIDSVNVNDTLTIITLSPVLGDTITLTERGTFNFFPAVDFFETATVYVSPSYMYYVRFTRRNGNVQLSDTLVEYSGIALTRLADISQHYQELQKGSYYLGSDPSLVILKTGSPPERNQQSLGIVHRDSSSIVTPANTLEERLIPFDPSRGIVRITNEMDVKLNLFSSYDGFMDASLFQLPDSTFALEVVRSKNGDVWKTRTILSEPELRRLQTKVFSTITLKNPNAGLDQSGRSIFLGNIYSVSIGLYGWGIPYLGNMSGSAAVGTFLMISAGSVLIANSATENSEISESAANVTLLGTGLGFLHGTLLSLIVNENSTNLDPFLALTMVGTSVEGLIAYQIAKSVKLSGSQIDVIATSSALGAVYGFGSSVLMDIHTTKGISTSIFIGSLTGTILGSKLSKDPQYTVGNMNVIRGSFFLGAYIPLTLLIAMEANTSKAYVSASMIGGIVGIVVGHGLIQHKNFTSEEGALIMSGVMGGALLGGGIPTLAGANPRISLLLSSVGAVVGYSMMYSKYSGTAIQRASTSLLDVSVLPQLVWTQAVRGSNDFPVPVVLPGMGFTLHF